MYFYERAEAVIDLDALLSNLELLRSGIPQASQIVAVIKADAYGHGARQAAKVLEPLDYVFGFAVATVEEGVSLREAGIRKPIMLLGLTFAPLYETAIRNDLWMVTFDEASAVQMAKTAAALGKAAQVQIAVDTGMNRIGCRVSEENADLIARIAALPDLVLQGMFTHFYLSDAADKTSADMQYARFQEMISLLTARGVKIPYLHCANSAAMIDLPSYSLNLVRAGIAMYGLLPSDEVRRIGLRPVMQVKARIVHLKTVPAGESVSYGGTYTAPEDRRIATIAFGYADGYPRTLSNQADVLVCGKRAPIRGRVCMDQIMVDVTEIPEASVGDEVTLIGAEGAERITMEELGAMSGRFNYETACCISKRVPRVYLSGGTAFAAEDAAQ